MQKQNLPKSILISSILIAFALIGYAFIYRHCLQTGKENNLSKPIKPIENAQTLKPAETIKPTDSEPINLAELETYKSELFLQAKWGKGKGEVGMLYDPEEASGDVGPNYGPQSFDIDKETGHLFLLDSVNSRVMKYNKNGKYINDFPVKYMMSEDIRVRDGFVYIFEYGIPAISKYTITGEFVEDYKIPSSEIIESPFLGLEFDVNSNIMLGSMGREKGVKYGSFEAGRKYKFYQIGKNGNEYENNNYIGFQSKDGKEYYLLGGIIKSSNEIERYILVFNRENELQREIKIELPRSGLTYFSGLDKNDNIYLEIQYSGGGGGIEIRKYNQEGKLLSVLEVSELVKKNNFIWWFTQIFKDIRVSITGDVYLMFSDTKEIKIYKYSQIKQESSQIFLEKTSKRNRILAKKVYEENNERIIEILGIDLNTGKEEKLFEIKENNVDIKFNFNNVFEDGSFLFVKEIDYWHSTYELWLWDGSKKELINIFSDPKLLDNREDFISGFVMDKESEKIAYSVTRGGNTKIYILDRDLKNVEEINFAEFDYLIKKFGGNEPQVEEIELILNGFLDPNRLIISSYARFKEVEGGYNNVEILNIRNKNIEKFFTGSLLDYHSTKNEEFILITEPDKGCCGILNGSNNITKFVDVISGKEIILINEYQKYGNEYNERDNKTDENMNKNYAVVVGQFSEKGDYIFLGQDYYKKWPDLENSRSMKSESFNDLFIFLFDSTNFSVEKISEINIGGLNFKSYISLENMLVSSYGSDLFILNLSESKSKKVIDNVRLIGIY